MQFAAAAHVMLGCILVLLSEVYRLTVLLSCIEGPHVLLF